jgi:hypothetical protein
MSDTPTHVTSLLSQLLCGEHGLTEAAASLRLDKLPSPLGSASVVELQAAPELVEKSSNVKYPTVHVYCDRIRNTLHEKFRKFSGTADLNIEVRVSHDHLDGLQQQLRGCVQAVTNVLDNSRGAWDANTWYAGAYEITFGAVKQGGRNYLQSARVRLEVAVQAD